jgi:aminocarboxymuconate-semialdehyde decarboxylase
MGDEDPAKTVASIPRLTDVERHQVCCGTALQLLGEGTKA